MKDECVYCGKQYDKKGVKRSLGRDSQVYQLGLCSSQCYTKWFMDRLEKEKENNSVQSYLQLLSEQCIDSSIHHKSLHEIMKKSGFRSETKYYLQPFKPELITELFEGWGLTKIYHEYPYTDGEYQLKFVNGYMETANKNGAIYGKIFTPRTLDDFINDCQRAGIELTWRIK
jgi:hypothetical protein